jgi:hypothetical protein
MPPGMIHVANRVTPGSEQPTLRSGRRLRHINGEKKIIEFAKHAGERELEAIAMAHINRKDLQIKRKFDDIEVGGLYSC